MSARAMVTASNFTQGVPGLGPQATPFRKLMGLGRMQEHQTVAVLLEKIVDVFPVAPGGLQADDDLVWRAAKLGELLVEPGKAVTGIGDRERFTHDAFVRREHGD